MNQLFRKSSLDRIASPEQLNDYIKATSPAAWLVLAAAVILLTGACLWGIFGRLETKLTAPVQVTDGKARLLLSQSRQIPPETSAVIDGKEYPVGQPAEPPWQTSPATDPRLLSLNDWTEGEWVQPYPVEADLPDGIYRADVLLESVPPISFVLN